MMVVVTVMAVALHLSQTVRENTMACQILGGDRVCSRRPIRAITELIHATFAGNGGWYTANQGRSAMTQDKQLRGWLRIAAIAIGVALLLLLTLHAYSGDSSGLVAILPLLFVGLISPLSLLSPLTCVYAGRTPDAPALPARFQRPPPFTLA
jgi:hypothetical protein